MFQEHVVPGTLSLSNKPLGLSLTPLFQMPWQLHQTVITSIAAAVWTEGPGAGAPVVRPQKEVQ